MFHSTCRKLFSFLVREKNGLIFWVFGICNNYPYVIMLSAANDILKNLENKTNITDSHNITTCSKIGTGAILLADIMPTFIFKIFAPLFIQNIRFPYKVSFVAMAAISSFIIVGFSNSITTAIIGVVLASLSSGVGEVTFLSLTAFYDKSSISYWSSGTGGAGLIGALSYAGLTTVMSSRNTLFSLSGIPIIIMIFYLFFLKKPENESFFWSVKPDYNIFVAEDENKVATQQVNPSIREKLFLIKSFLVLTIPLCLVYTAEYVINQAYFELMYFGNSKLNEKEQYRWYQVSYQLGVFISRSSLYLLKVKHTWIFAVLQILNVAFFLFQIIYKFIPYVWIVIICIVYEGLLGGAAYVNTFYMISIKSDSHHKEFNMAAGSMWDSFGIMVAGFMSLPIHNTLCDKYF